MPSIPGPAQKGGLYRAFDRCLRRSKTAERPFNSPQCVAQPSSKEKTQGCPRSPRGYNRRRGAPTARSRSSSSHFFEATGVPLNLLFVPDSVFSLFLCAFIRYAAHDHRLFSYLKRRLPRSQSKGTCATKAPAPPVSFIRSIMHRAQRLFHRAS